MTAGNGITDAKAGGWAAAVLIATAVLLVFLAFAPQTSLWDRDEPRFARAAVEMARSGNWLYPTFNGAVRPDKPILIYWLMASSVRWMGATEGAVRCWSALAAALSCLFTFLIGRRLFSVRSGLLAMLILATSPLFMLEAAAATADAVLLAATTAAMAAFVSLLDAPTLGRACGLTAAFAIAQLAKGPVGLLVPLAAMLGALVLTAKTPEAVGQRRIGVLVVAAAAVSVLIFLLWAIPANAASGGTLARVGLGHHVLERIVSPLESHGGPYLLALPYYLPVVAFGFMPWILHVPGALYSVVSGGQGGGRARSVLVPWIVLPVVGFSLVATRLPHYVLPVWPALAVAVAGTLEAARRGALCATGRLWLRRGVWLYCPLTLLILVGGAVLALRSPIDGLGVGIAVITAGLAVVAAIVICDQLAGRPWASTGVLLAAIIATQIRSRILPCADGRRAQARSQAGGLGEGEPGATACSRDLLLR